MMVCELSKKIVTQKLCLINVYLWSKINLVDPLDHNSLLIFSYVAYIINQYGTFDIVSEEERPSRILLQPQW